MSLTNDTFCCGRPARANEVPALGAVEDPKSEAPRFVGPIKKDHARQFPPPIYSNSPSPG